jgi:hypothetical protein
MRAGLGDFLTFLLLALLAGNNLRHQRYQVAFVQGVGALFFLGICLLLVAHDLGWLP